MPAYQLAYSCGTCGLVLRRQPGAPAGPLSAVKARDRLADGLADLDSDVIETFSLQVPRGDYLVMLLDVEPQLVAPGSRLDYFAHEQPAAWQNDEYEYGTDPTNMAYYRLGDAVLANKRHLFEFVVPMTDPDLADPATVDRYAASQPGIHPTAVAFGVLDISGPWFSPEQHWGLFHYLLDGHHKAAAAARAGQPLRMLSFVSFNDSLARDEYFLRLPEILPAGTNTAQSE